MIPPGTRVLVSMATYNERDNLELLIKEIHAVAPQADVLVTDDNSPDGTGRLADQLASADPRIHVIHRAGKLGLGTAILAGMHFAMEQDYDWLINMDADFSHHPRYLPPLFAGMQRHDLVIGSRYVPGGGTLNWPLSRQLMSWGINVLVRFLMRIRARDTSGGYRCYSVALLRRTDLKKLISRGYSFQEEVLYRCRRAGCKIAETPILFEDRRAGDSKVNLKEVTRSLSTILLLGLQAFFGLD
ncbi:MAG: polyprenol monophosphomannose synthase [Gemmataceae bacterium]|nr:polyprenol monophosphomannose synthase [Gemmataceae bacterium]MCI0737925.1 polyprenol monophosphomannose synthase [Gemmataceae bacterium]